MAKYQQITDPKPPGTNAIRVDQSVPIPSKNIPSHKQSSNRITKAKVLDSEKLLPDFHLEFHGSSREYFRIWIVNLCLTLLTLGIFSAWAKVRKKRYIYTNTTMDGTPFQYLGRPLPILVGRLIAVAGFILYYISRHFFTTWLPFVIGAGIVLAPWVLTRSVAFNTRYSAYRNLTFHFIGKYLIATKTLYLWGLIPIIFLAVFFGWLSNPYAMAFSAIVFIIAYPWWLQGIKKFIVENVTYGGIKGVFSATGSQYLKIHALAILIGFIIIVPMLTIFMFFFTTFYHIAFLMILPAVVYIGYLASYAYARAKTINLAWNNTQLGPLRFKSNLPASGLIKIYLTNALGILVSLGLLIPWAVIRTLKYRIHHLYAYQDGILSQFQGNEKDEVTAIGIETMDVFDVDLSL